MKNPLLKHTFNRISDSGLKILTTMLLLLVMIVGSMQAQTPAINKTECSCLNNASNATNGQYLDAFTITTNVPGQTWVLVNPIAGFYHPASLPPPAAPILYLPNTLIPETSTPGVYRISGKRVSGQPWTVRVRNVSNGYETEVHSIQSCSYPNSATTTAIAGDVNVCMNSIEAYSLPAGLYSGLAWNVSGGATSTTNPSPFTTFNVTWGPTAGRYSIGVSGVANSYAAQPVGCLFASTKIVDVINPAPYTTIRGDYGNCLGDTETYTIAATATQLTGVSWGIYTDPGLTIPAVGISLAVGSINSKTITWPNTPGTYYLTVSGNFRINSSADFCTFRDVKRIVIMDEPTIPLACNNLVQISMNPSCELYFTPDQFLEDPLFDEDYSYDIIIRDIQKDTLIPNGTLGFKYIGKTLEVKIVHECSGNSCWGYAKIEDKSIPDLVCPPNIEITCDQLGSLAVTGMPVFPVGVTLSPVAGTTNSWILTGYDRCSLVTLKYVDTVTNADCSDVDFSSYIDRVWTVTDGSGNTSTCTQVISVERASIVDVIFPSNWDSATGPNASLEACGTWPKIAYKVNGIEQTYVLNGVTKVDSVPDPAYTGYPFGIQCLKASVAYTDKKILLCGTNPHAYKLIRKWQVVDHCAAEPNKIREMNQLITVMDTNPPTITAPGDITTSGASVAALLYTAEHKCTADWSVRPPVIISDCTTATWEISFILADNTGAAPVNATYVKKSGTTEVTGSYPNFTIKNLPAGYAWLKYTAIDLCGNTSDAYTEILVVDNQPPTPVCDKNSIVAIGANAESYAGVLTFDDGSHDNCALKCMKIRRVDNPVAWSSLPCDNQLKFTCNDIGVNKTVSVELYVEDYAGLFNTCMVTAKVQDNIFPVLTPPANTTANCYEDLTSLTRFGSATVTDNCSATVRDSVVRNLNDCGVGTITRYFIATDVSGNKVIRNQVITVGNNKAFTGSDIDWPDTYTTNASCASDIKPENLSDLYARPKFIRNTDCAQLASSYEDIVFNFADNVCVKILRQWKVIDWCQRNPLFPGSGEWTYTQLIMVNNVKAPDITKGCSTADLVITQVGSCSANVSVTATATDDCTPVEKLEWTYTIDEGNNGSLEVTNGTGATVNRVFPYGTHKINWTVKDGCKNVKTCSNTFTIADDKKPTPYCITELVTVIMSSSKEVTIWASDFDKGATDNCSVGNQITASFSANNRNDISRTIRCADLNGEASKEFTYNVYAIDAAGNSDFCTVRLKVQDNNNSCTTSSTTQVVSLRGNVFTEADEALQNVQIELSSNQTEFPKTIKTGTDGQFAFAELPINEDYVVAAEKNDDVLNGVTTLDLVHIQRHILGLAALESPYKMIAADVNNSAKVTASDIVELRKVILGIQPLFVNNKSWRFVDAAYKFADAQNPFPYIEVAEMTDLNHNVDAMDFVAVKIGDVNGSAKANVGSGDVTSRSQVRLLVPTITANAGDIVNIDINAEEYLSLAGMQMTLEIDNSLVELVDIQSQSLNFGAEHMGFGRLSDGLINISWNDNVSNTVKDKILTIKVKVLKSVVDKSVLTLQKSQLAPELYLTEGADIQTASVQLSTISREKPDSDIFEVYQNVPNPFNASTVIGFNLPASNVATVKLFDLTGKLVYQNSQNFQKGYNTFTIDAQSLNLNGVLYYQIDTDTDSATRKMIIIK
ncbi:MAG: T9SS type A sorting domain-containing protein [Saprospiraceae bacterium]|nr:T9SS type A sorting domain-containing protein [Saprospiraceae bacterium]